MPNCDNAPTPVSMRSTRFLISPQILLFLYLNLNWSTHPYIFIRISLLLSCMSNRLCQSANFYTMILMWVIFNANYAAADDINEGDIFTLINAIFCLFHTGFLCSSHQVSLFNVRVIVSQCLHDVERRQLINDILLQSPSSHKVYSRYYDICGFCMYQKRKWEWCANGSTDQSHLRMWHLLRTGQNIGQAPWAFDRMDMCAV
jgi:hypothetical protein